VSTRSNATTPAEPVELPVPAPEVGLVVVVDPEGRWVAVQFDGQLGGYGPWQILDCDGGLTQRFTLPAVDTPPALPYPSGGEAA
jgi:hypothetical protein